MESDDRCHLQQHRVADRCRIGADEVLAGPVRGEGGLRGHRGFAGCGRGSVGGFFWVGGVGGSSKPFGMGVNGRPTGGSGAADVS